MSIGCSSTTALSPKTQVHSVTGPLAACLASVHRGADSHGVSSGQFVLRENRPEVRDFSEPMPVAIHGSDVSAFGHEKYVRWDASCRIGVDVSATDGVDRLRQGPTAEDGEPIEERQDAFTWLDCQLLLDQMSPVSNSALMRWTVVPVVISPLARTHRYGSIPAYRGSKRRMDVDGGFGRGREQPGIDALRATHGDEDLRPPRVERS